MPTQRCAAGRPGFRGVEVWAACHSLLDQFWTPWSNSRTDQWGGSLQNRTRFSCRLIVRIRRACGVDFIAGRAISNFTACIPGPDTPVEALPERQMQQVHILTLNRNSHGLNPSSGRRPTQGRGKIRPLP